MEWDSSTSSFVNAHSKGVTDITVSKDGFQRSFGGGLFVMVNEARVEVRRKVAGFKAWKDRISD